MKNLVLLTETQTLIPEGAVDVDELSDKILLESGQLAGDTTFKLSEIIPSAQTWFFLQNDIALSREGAVVSLGTRELIGEFELGIRHARWSPDAELLALIVGNSLVVMTNGEYDFLHQVELDFVEDEDEPILVSWKQDGSQLCVSGTTTDRREIYIYDRETMQLQAKGLSEDGSGKPVPNLLPVLTWGRHLLASAQTKGKSKLLVTFFEPNGLRHGDFLLRDKEHPARILFNPTSEILAVGFQKRIQLWHRSNYHWYLKYEIQLNASISFIKFTKEETLCVGLTGVGMFQYDFCWDVSLLHNVSTALNIDGKTLHHTPLDRALVPPPMSFGQVHFEECIQQIASYPDGMVVLLANGKMMLLDNTFGKPTPIESGDESTNTASKVTFRHLTVVESNDSTIRLIAALSKMPGVDEIIEIEVNVETASSQQLDRIQLESKVLRIVNWTDKAEKGALIELDDGSLLEYMGDSTILPSDAEAPLEPCPWIAGLSNTSNSSPLVVGLSSKSHLYCHDRMLSDGVSSFILGRRFFLNYVTAAGGRSIFRSIPLQELIDFDPFEGSEHMAGMLDGYEPRFVERGARLICVLQQSAILQMPRGNLEGIYPRSLVLPTVMSLISSQQFAAAFKSMRRQKVDLNLLVDFDPVAFLDKGGIDVFIEQVTKVDSFNLFISSLQDFDVTESLCAVKPWMNLERSEEPFDFTTKVNKVCEKLRELLLEATANGRTRGGREIPNGFFLLPILSTFAKETPPKLEEALSMIRDQASAVGSTNGKSPLLMDQAQKSVQYLAFLANYDMLYKTALAMYDFDLARAVARNSQMDPKVYLPVLKRFRSLPMHYAKYEVDVRLERYGEALKHMYQSGKKKEDTSEFIMDPDVPIFGNTFEDCLAFANEHKLQTAALHLFDGDEDKRVPIMNSLAERLLTEDNKAQAALSIFLASNNIDGAQRAARSAGDWRQFFILVDSVQEGQDPEVVKLQKERLAHEVAEEVASLRTSKNRRKSLADSARILLDYGNDVVSAVGKYCEAEMWSEARRLALKHDRSDLVQKKCVESALKYAETAIQDFEDRETTFKTTTERYAEVVKIRKDAKRELEERGFDTTEQQAMDDSGSMFSLASNASLRSTASTGSVSSTVSSVLSISNQSTFSMTTEDDRNRHKSKYNQIGREDKKKKKKKKTKRERNKRAIPGSEEELANLVSTLKFMIVDPEYVQILGETCIFLSQVGELEVAKALYNSYIKFQSSIASCQSERIETTLKEATVAAKEARKGGNHTAPIVLPCEKEIDALRCVDIQENVVDLFTAL